MGRSYERKIKEEIDHSLGYHLWISHRSRRSGCDELPLQQKDGKNGHLPALWNEVGKCWII